MGITCVNALGGLFSFLPIYNIIFKVKRRNECQCPQRALLISTLLLDTYDLYDVGVNALGGLFSFLQNHPVFRNQVNVSMPSAGSSHFYLVNGSSPKFSKELCVNALGGLFSFLPKEEELTTKVIPNCVNALGGLFSFLPEYCCISSCYHNCVSMPSAGSSHFYQ